MKLTSSKHPAILERNADPEYMVTRNLCFDLDGCHFCSASNFELGMRADDQGNQCIGVMFSRGAVGLHWGMTPPGARELAQHLLVMADELEARQLADAKAQLDAALNQGRSA